jgi:N-acetylneuraminic acid mutarotase
MRSRRVQIGMIAAIAGVALALMLILALAATPALYAAPPPATWQALASAPAPVEGACTGVIGDKIYVAFGFSGVDSSALRIYDIPSNTWSFGPSAPTAGRSEAYQGVVHGGKLYCAFGRSTPEAWSFDPATSTWTMLAPTPDLRAGTGADSWGNSIYYFGGRNALFGPCNGPPVTPADPDGTIVRFDIDAGTWSPAGDLVVPVTDATVTTVGSLIYIFGGCDSSVSAVSTLQIYDPRTETTTLGAPMPSPRSDAASAAAGPHTIRIVGGEDTVGADPAVNHLIYDVETGTYATGPSVPTHCPFGIGRGEHTLVSHGGRMYAVVGSCPGFGASLDNLDVLKTPGA